MALRRVNIEKKKSAANEKSAAKSKIAPPLTEFTIFSALPKELQLKIWRRACQAPRIVEVEFDFRSWTMKPVHLVQDPIPFSSPTITPAILHTSHDARHEAFKFYKRMFQNYGLGGAVKIAGKEDFIYINPRIDTVFFTAREGFECPVIREVRTLSNLHMPDELWSTARECEMALLFGILAYCKAHPEEISLIKSIALPMPNPPYSMWGFHNWLIDPFRAHALFTSYFYNAKDVIWVVEDLDVAEAWGDLDEEEDQSTACIDLEAGAGADVYGGYYQFQLGFFRAKDFWKGYRLAHILERFQVEMRDVIQDVVLRSVNAPKMMAVMPRIVARDVGAVDF